MAFGLANDTCHGGREASCPQPRLHAFPVGNHQPGPDVWPCWFPALGWV